jgi:hypothetical protein
LGRPRSAGYQNAIRATLKPAVYDAAVQGALFSFAVMADIGVELSARFCVLEMS